MSKQRNPSDPGAPEDEPRDARLRAALRHAPDADQQPPPHLSAQILAAAHRAAAQPRVSARAAPTAQRWWWPASLGASGALASFLLAGVIGLMWREAPPGAGADEPTAAIRAGSPAAPSVVAEAGKEAQSRAAIAAGPFQAPQPRLAAPATASKPAPPALASAASPAPGTKSDAAPVAALAQPEASASVTAAPAPPPAPPETDSPPLRLPLAQPGQQIDLSGQRSGRAATSPAPLAATGRAGPAAAELRWRIDGVDRGPASPGWVLQLSSLDQERGQPETAIGRRQASALPPAAASVGLAPMPSRARDIELRDASGAVVRVQLSEQSLRWCPSAASTACRLSVLSPAESRALMQAIEPLPPAASPTASPDASNVGQPGQRDSK